MTIEFPDKEYLERINKAQLLLRDKEIGGLLVQSTEGFPYGTRYFANFWPSFEYGFLFIPSHGKPVLFTGVENAMFAREISPIELIEVAKECTFHGAPDYHSNPAPSMLDVVLDLLAGDEMSDKLAIYPYGLFSHDVLDNFARKVSNVEFLDGNGEILVPVRQHKSVLEVEAIRQASRLAQDAFASVLSEIHEGVTESAIMDRINAFTAQRGSERHPYYGWCASGPNTKHAIHRSGDRAVQEGDLVTMCVGSTLSGYCGSYGRAIAIGNVDPDVHRMVDDAIEIEEATTKAAKPGAVAHDVASSINSMMTAKGYSPLYGPLHSTGLEECELPWVQENSQLVLQENMTFNLDIWLERDGNGVRIEDGIVITKNGCDMFTSDFRSLNICPVK